MKPYIYRVEPNPNYDQSDIENQAHQYTVDFLLDSLIVWYKTRDRPQTFDAEKVRCNQVISKISRLLKKITTKPTHQLKETVTVNMLAIQNSMVEQLPFFSEETRNFCFRQIGDHLREYRE